jgi:lysophospholipase L1-like esterase
VKKLAAYTFIIIVSVAVLAEISLRVMGEYMLYSEINGRPYYNGYNTVTDNWYRTYLPHQKVEYQNPDFNYPFYINAIGIREHELDTAKSDSVLRILVTGDSFAEGIGAPYDSTWPRLLEKYLQQEGVNAEVINAGVAGSDIYFAYAHYRDVLKNYKPDLIIASLNSSDYVEYLQRGGMERFHADGTTHYKQAPWYEPLYHYSRLFRALCHKFGGFWITGLFVSADDYVTNSPTITKQFADVYGKFNSEAHKNGAVLIALLHPTPFELPTNEQPIFESNIKNIAYLQQLLTQQHITTYNLTTPLKQKFARAELATYCHPHDHHFKPIGYNYMAALLADSILHSSLMQLKSK